MHLAETQTAGMKKLPVPLGVGGSTSSPGLLLSFMTLALPCPKRDASRHQPQQAAVAPLDG